MYMCICAFKHFVSHELVLNSNSRVIHIKLEFEYPFCFIWALSFVLLFCPRFWTRSFCPPFALFLGPLFCPFLPRFWSHSSSQEPFWAPKKGAAKGEKFATTKRLYKGKPTRGYLWVGKVGTSLLKICTHFLYPSGYPWVILEHMTTLREKKPDITTKQFQPSKIKKIKGKKWVVHTGTTNRSVRSGTHQRTMWW